MNTAQFICVFYCGMQKLNFIHIFQDYLIKIYLLHNPSAPCPISHNALLCNRNVHMWAHFCYKIVYCGICEMGQFYHAIDQILVKQPCRSTVYPKKYAHGFVVLCFVVVMQSFIMNSHEVFIHIHQGCFAGTGAIVRLPQCQWSKPDGYGKISQCITTTKHSKAKTVCIFLGIYCICK